MAIETGADSVDLVDEEDARCRLARFLEGLAHGGGEHRTERMPRCHSPKVPVTSGEPARGGHGTGEPGLARARRAGDEKTVRHIGPAQLARPPERKIAKRTLRGLHRRLFGIEEVEVRPSSATVVRAARRGAVRRKRQATTLAGEVSRKARPRAGRPSPASASSVGRVRVAAVTARRERSGKRAAIIARIAARSIGGRTCGAGSTLASDGGSVTSLERRITQGCGRASTPRCSLRTAQAHGIVTGQAEEEDGLGPPGLRAPFDRHPPRDHGRGDHAVQWAPWHAPGRPGSPSPHRGVNMAAVWGRR